jgi:hypothetical protein
MLTKAPCRWKMHKPTSGAILPYQMHTFYGILKSRTHVFNVSLENPEIQWIQQPVYPLSDASKSTAKTGK